jgi:tRNA-dihydrouridine synthase
LGAPWLIRDAGHYLAHGVIPPEPTLRTRLECYLRQVRWMAQMKDERYALARAKQVFSGYSKHCGGCKPLKHPIQFAQSVDEVADAVRRYVEDQGEMAEAVPVSWADRDAMFQTERRRAGLSVEGEPVGV